ncbi:MAG: serine protease [Chloroflexota bacterium]
MSWNQNLTNLRDWFADRYITVDDSRVIAEDANLDIRRIRFDNQSITNWHNILRFADKQRMVSDLIDVARKENVNDEEFLLLAQKGLLTGVRGVDITTDIAWKGIEDSDQLEKLTSGRNALLPAYFLDLGAKKARSVVRVKLSDGGSGSGFLTGDNLLITNYHVIKSEEEAQQAKIQCNFQLTSSLHDAPITDYKLVPNEGFATSKADDWTAVRVQGNPNDKWGALPLLSTNPQQGEWLNIIQHPNGGPKQIAFHDNPIVFVDESRIQYLTDTTPGSSGSPCFDSSWNVVALHHSGGYLREPGTKNNKRYYRNEGIHINRVIAGLVDAGLRDAS